MLLDVVSIDRCAAYEISAESDIRKRVDEIYRRAGRGLVALRGIVNARVEELGNYFTDLVNLLLAVTVGQGAKLLGKDVLDAFLVSSLSEL